MTRDDITNSELDAFLNGEDDLSRRLQALPQEGPSAQLDKAILDQVRGPEAANDAGMQGSAPRPVHFSLRWRIPAGIAATVLAGVLANDVWRADIDARRQAEVPAALPAERSAPGTFGETGAPTPSAPQLELSPMPPPPPPPTRRPRRETPPARATAEATFADGGSAQDKATEPSSEARPALGGDLARQAPAALDLAAPQPVAAPAAAPLARAQSKLEGSRVTVTGARSKALPADPAATEWEDLIDKLLKAGLNRDALKEWEKFRSAYPDRPAPDTLRERIDAARAAQPRPQ